MRRKCYDYFSSMRIIMVALEKKVDGIKILSWEGYAWLFIDETWIIWMQKIIQGEYWNWLRNCYENFYEKIYEKKKKKKFFDHNRFDRMHV